MLFRLLFPEAKSNQFTFNFSASIKFSGLYIALSQQRFKKLWQEFESFAIFQNFKVFLKKIAEFVAVENNV